MNIDVTKFDFTKPEEIRKAFQTITEAIGGTTKIIFRNFNRDITEADLTQIKDNEGIFDSKNFKIIIRYQNSFYETAALTKRQN